MKLKKYSHNNEKMYTKAIRLFQGNGKKEKLILVISYSKSLGRRRWHDDNNKPRLLGYFKSKTLSFTARAIVLKSHKFSLIVSK